MIAIRREGVEQSGLGHSGVVFCGGKLAQRYHDCWFPGRPFQHGINQVIEQPAQVLGLDVIGDHLRTLLVLVDKPLRFVECSRFLVEMTNLLDLLCCIPGRIIEQCQQRLSVVFLKGIQGKCQQNSRPAAKRIEPGGQLVVIVPLPVSQVIENLEGDSQVTGKMPDRISKIID